jgi:electron transport complex protein RnfB
VRWPRWPIGRRRIAADAVPALGFAACRPYAEAVAAGEAINRCARAARPASPPSPASPSRLPLALDAAHGSEGPLRLGRASMSVALHRLRAVPRSLSGRRDRGWPEAHAHTVLSAGCTGCERLPPCPVDCILLVPAGREWSSADARPRAPGSSTHRRAPT